MMIVELVIIKNRDGISCAEEFADAQKGAQAWLTHSELVAKHFIRDGEFGGAVYFWPSKEAAERAHDEKWRQGVLARTGGNPPEIRYFDLMMSCEPPKQAITEYGTP
jgi:hypothetical protein